jgi:hypothetical protein
LEGEGIRKSTSCWGESTGAGEAYLGLEQLPEIYLELEQLPETTLSPGIPGSRHLYLDSDSEEVITLCKGVIRACKVNTWSSRSPGTCIFPDGESVHRWCEHEQVT